MYPANCASFLQCSYLQVCGSPSVWEKLKMNIEDLQGQHLPPLLLNKILFSFCGQVMTVPFDAADYRDGLP